jgi:hypothetical protein
MRCSRSDSDEDYPRLNAQAAQQDADGKESRRTESKRLCVHFFELTDSSGGFNVRGMKTRSGSRSHFRSAIALALLALSACTGTYSVEEANRRMLQETGLHQEETDADGMGAALAKNHSRLRCFGEDARRQRLGPLCG